jgi:elongation factor Ts
MEIAANLVKELRERTQAGFMDCRKALVEAEGDAEKAFEILKKSGVLKAHKKSDRETAEGVVGSYIHAGNKIGVLVEVNCETDFVARTDNFKDLVRNLAMHIAAAAPIYVDRNAIPEEDVNRMKKAFLGEVQDKPEKVRGSIVEGKLEKFFQESCLLDQPYVKDPGVVIRDLIASEIAKMGENISVNRFSRFQIGERKG